MTDMLNWGLLSTARINRRLIPAIEVAGRSNLVAVASRKPETAREFAARWNIPRAFDSYEAMLAAAEIDAVYIPLPNTLHHEWAIKAARAGKHILCEKPLAMTVTEVDEMAAAARENGVTLVEGFMYRMHPQLARLQQLIAAGLIGPVKIIRAKFSFTLHDRSNIRLQKEVGGGSLWDVGCYPVNFAQAIAGAEPVAALGWQITGPGGTDVVFAGQLKFPGGVIAQIYSGFDLPFRTGAEVVGDKGTIYIGNPWQPDVDGKPSGLLHIAPDDTETPIPVAAKDPYLCEIEVMERAILDGAPVPYTLEHSRGNIAAITALYQSAERGEVVHLA